jgi:hypothetical protein
MPRISCGADMKSRAAIRRSHRSRIKPRETARTTLNESRTDQFRLRVARARRTKPATTATSITIQYWASKPKKEKFSTRKCNAFGPHFPGRKGALLARDRRRRLDSCFNIRGSGYEFERSKPTNP